MLKRIALFTLSAGLCLGFLPLRPAIAQSDKDALNDDDKKFVMQAAQGGMGEVKLGQLAAEKAGNDQVKKFGEMMVADHSKANDELKALAAQKNLTPPEDMGRYQKAYDKLAKLSGADFDKAYVNEMIDDHKDMVKMFAKQAERGGDRDLREWAAKTLPALQNHLAMISDIDKSMGGKGVDMDKPDRRRDEGDRKKDDHNK